MRSISSIPYRFLDIGQGLRKADLIFVHAGRPERKIYGLHLYHCGYADRIVFSVGRFEWRRFLELGLEDDGGLVDLVRATLPKDRHFFVAVERGQARCFRVPVGKLGTLSEAIALRRFIENRDVRRLLVVTSGIHLRRSVSALAHCCFTSDLKIIPVAVPESASSWPHAKSARAQVKDVGQEFAKTLLYQLVIWCIRGRKLILRHRHNADRKVPSASSTSERRTMRESD